MVIDIYKLTTSWIIYIMEMEISRLVEVFVIEKHLLLGVFLGLLEDLIQLGGNGRRIGLLLLDLRWHWHARIVVVASWRRGSRRLFVGRCRRWRCRHVVYVRAERVFELFFALLHFVSVFGYLYY